jgi:hypothetical protein
VLVGIILTVALMVGGLLLAWAAWLRAERARALPGVAAAAGLRFSEVDLFNTLAVPFPLFRAGDGRTIQNVMWREARGSTNTPTRVFDYSWYEEHRDRRGRERRRWEYLSCAFGQHNGAWPVITIERGAFVDRVGRLLGLPTVELESEEFNRTFAVRCADAKFATDLLSPQLMEFLLTTKGTIRFETRGRFLLASTSRVDAALMPGLLAVVEQFLALVPPVVRELYGSFPDGAGTEHMPPPTSEPAAPAGERSGGLGGVFQTRWDSAPQRAFEFAPPPDLRREGAWDPTPGVDHDLDGNVVANHEDPWGPGRPLPGRE